MIPRRRSVVKHNRLNTLDIEISVSTGVAVREEDAAPGERPVQDSLG